MSPDLTTMLERVMRLREELAARRPTPALLAEIEDVLTEGYAHALDGDAWSTRTEERLLNSFRGSNTRVCARDQQAVMAERSGVQRELVELRRELTELWRERDRLRSGSRRA